MKKCEGHINWLTCEKMKDYRFKQEFCCLANHTGKSLYATGRNVSKYSLTAVPIDLKCTFSLFLQLHKDEDISRISYKNVRVHQLADRFLSCKNHCKSLNYSHPLCN